MSANWPPSSLGKQHEPKISERDLVSSLAADFRRGELSSALDRIDAHRALVDANETASYLAGLARAASGDAERARRHFSCALAINPRNARALEARAIALQNLSRLNEAIADGEELTRLETENAGAWTLLAAVYFQARRLNEAHGAYTTALSRDSLRATALAGRGLTLHLMGRDREAIADYERALARTPADKSLWHNLAVSLNRLDETQQALASFQRALAIDPNYLAAADGAAFALLQLKRFDEAVALCDAALRRRPAHLPAKFMKANALHELRLYPEALGLYDEALKQAPDDAKLLANRGMTLLQLGEFEGALRMAERALRQEPKFALAWRCKGSAELKLSEIEAALASFEIALGFSQEDADLLCGRAIALKELARFDEALGVFDAALTQDRAHVEAKANKGALLLLLGRYEEGLPLFEYRWIRGETAKADTVFAWPEWKGEALAGKRLLVLDEAGLGDVIQYSRYLPLLSEAGAKVGYACRPSMRKLMASLAPTVELVEPPAEEDERGKDERRGESRYDYCVALCSLPDAMGTTLETIPAQIPYLRADPERVAFWRARIGEHGFKVGLAWRGSAHKSADHSRSAPLKAFAPLAKIAGVRLVSLQKNLGVEEIADWPGELQIETLGEAFDAGSDAFLDTAAVIETLDLVITIDTSVAHLAGALGKPVWVALKHVPEWRWLLERADHPWYPTARLFRQERRGDWDGLFLQMAQALGLQLQKKTLEAAPILIPASVGDLIDRLTILEIKAQKIEDTAKRANVSRELVLLSEVKAAHALSGGRLAELEHALKAANLALWDIEDNIRRCEAEQNFGPEFIGLARSVYFENDRRAQLKREINLLCGSRLIEEKSYAGDLSRQSRD